MLRYGKVWSSRFSFLSPERNKLKQGAFLGKWIQLENSRLQNAFVRLSQACPR